MTKAMGYNTHYLIKRAAAFGVNPGGNFVKVPVRSTSLGRKQANVANALLGEGRDPQAQIPDVYEVGGNTVVPVDPRYIGFWLTGMFGSPVTTGGSPDPYTHVFKSGALSLPDYAHEVAHKGPGAYEMNLGVMVDSLQFRKPNTGGYAEVTVGLIGASNASAGTSGGGSPTVMTKTYASNLQGTLKKAGSALATITDFNFTVSNGLKADREVNSNGEQSAIDADMVTISGSMTSRFTDKTLYDLAWARTPFDLELAYNMGANLSLSLKANEILCETPDAPISGPGGYSLNFNFKGQYNAGAGAAFTATLVNDLAGTTYA